LFGSNKAFFLLLQLGDRNQEGFQDPLDTGEKGSGAYLVAVERETPLN